MTEAQNEANKSNTIQHFVAMVTANQKDSFRPQPNSTKACVNRARRIFDLFHDGKVNTAIH